MAFGDPMVLDTRYNWNLNSLDNFDTLLVGGKFDGSALDSDGVSPIGWVFNAGVSGGKSMLAGTRTGGSGSYVYRMQATSPGAVTLSDVYQKVRLNGNENYDANGHAGRPFTFSIWARNAGTGTVTITLSLRAYRENLTTANTIDDSISAPVALTGTWTQYIRNVTPGNPLTAAYMVQITCAVTVNGNPDVQFDESEFYTTYTFAVNAAMPDSPRILVPNRTYQRTTASRLLRHRPRAGNAAKHEYELNFGLIGLTQLQALRSLWLLDTPLRWKPNLPHLPTYIAVMMVDNFDLSMKSPSVNSNNYSGSLRLSEF